MPKFLISQLETREGKSLTQMNRWRQLGAICLPNLPTRKPFCLIHNTKVCHPNLTDCTQQYNNNLITILHKQAQCSTIWYFSRAQADVNLPNSIARKQHNNKKKKRIWRTTTTNVWVLGIFLASPPSCEKHYKFIWHCRVHLVPNSEECSPCVTLNNFEFIFWSHILKNDHEECSLCDILINFEFIVWSHILRNVYGGMFTRCYFEQLWAHFLLSHLFEEYSFSVGYFDQLWI